MIKLTGATILFIFLHFSAVPCFARANKEATEKALIPARKANVKARNIIFILTDDHRYDFMGFAGRLAWLKMPNMDRLYKEGAWFKNAFVTTSLCSP